MKLKVLTKKEFDKYVVHSVSNYEKELIKMGHTESQAKQESKATFDRILPKGMDTEGHIFNYAYDNEELIGFIWYGFRGKDNAFIYDFEIVEEKRRQGYGRKVMLACEQEAKEKGAKVMGLHVFGHNKGARALYESLNYYPTSIQMKKNL